MIKKITDFGVFFVREKLIMNNLSKIPQVTADYMLLKCVYVCLLCVSPKQRCCESQQ